MESKRFGSSVLAVCLVFLLVASQEVQAHESDLAFKDLFGGKINESDLAFMDLFGGNINVCLVMCRREAKVSKAECQKLCTFLFLTAEGAKLDARSKSKSRKVKN